jgi:uncharacterized phage protein gp47/JayE
MTTPTSSTPTTASIAAQMMAALRASEPDLDTAIGTPLRKILDAVAESIAESYTDQHLIQYTYDIDSKVGADLDDFVELFGLARIPAQRAVGVVTFSRPYDPNLATTATIIPPGTQVVALTSPVVYVQTTVSAVLNPGQVSADVPVQAISAGSAGNVAAGLCSTLVSLTGVISNATNSNPISGGSAAESDDALRARFKATVFRSLAGTGAMYQAVALEIPQDPTTPNTPAISQVNVLGSSKRWREQIQIVSGSATSALTGAAYIFADNVFCGPNIDGGSMLSLGSDFSFTPSNPTNRSNASVTIAALNSNMPDGLYDLDYEYVPQASRNDPGNTRFNLGGTNNRIDVWANGQVLDTSTQAVIFSNSKVFSSSSASQYWNQLFSQSNNDSSPNPSVGNIFIPLAFGPILSVPSQISVGGTTYNLGSDYWIVHQSDCFGYSTSSLFGLAWNSSRLPANGSTFSLPYTYNKVARLLQDAITQWRLVGTDAVAHCGVPVYIRCYLAVMFDRRYDPTAATSAINTALAAFINGLGFEAPLQVSDVLQVVHNVPGVDNVRFLNSTDNGSQYGIVQMSAYNPNTQIALFAAGGRAKDVQFTDSQYPVFHSTVITPKAANSFGVF